MAQDIVVKLSKDLVISDVHCTLGPSLTQSTSSFVHNLLITFPSESGRGLLKINSIACTVGISLTNYDNRFCKLFFNIRYYGSRDWPPAPLLLPGNSLWFVLESTAEVDGVTADQCVSK
uniref:Trafficking protein particle complex subunit 9 n=1 Tax=Heterorhabditis bacteriophora TaxID=37862 RepID=A0A1I7X4W9_HETBA